MIFKIRFSAPARRELRNIVAYIRDDLSAPEVATRQYHRIMTAIKNLETMPFRHRLLEEEPWKTEGVRWMRVDNYRIIYKPDEAQQVVGIIAIMYEGRDIPRQLNRIIDIES